MIVAALLLQAAAPPPWPVCPKLVTEPERQSDGIYVDQFEAQRFYEHARSLKDIERRATGNTWLNLDLLARASSFGITRRVPNYAYRVRFRGIRKVGGTAPFCGVGHMGMSDAVIDVTELLAIEPLGSSVSSDNRR